MCVLGEGSAQYGITALWTAVAYKAPVTFLVLRNEEYMILKWFAAMEQVSGRARARAARASTRRRSPAATGCRRGTSSDPGELVEALREAIAAQDGPRLVQARVASGMWLE